MAITKYIAQALAFSSTAYAGCSASSATTIVNPAGASALATCTTYQGDVVLATGVASLQNTVDLGSTLQEIDGALTYENDPQVQTIKAGSLSKVGDLKFNNLSALAQVDLSGLKEGGDLTFTGLSILQSLGLGGTLSKAGKVTIVNTQIGDISGVDTISEIDGLDISDNLFLTKIDLAVKEIGSVNIGSGKVGQTSSMPNLANGDLLVFRNAATVSLPKLMNVTDNLELHNCTFQSFTAPNLTTAGGFICNDNPNLNNVTLPQLTAIKGDQGAFQIANNTKLSNINGFPALTSVKFNIDLSGSFSNVSFPQLNNVGGAFTVDTSAQQFNCPAITGLQGNVVKGEVQCHFADPDPTRGGNPTGGQTGGSGGNSGAGAVNVPLLSAAATVALSMLSMLLL